VRAPAILFGSKIRRPPLDRRCELIIALASNNPIGRHIESAGKDDLRCFIFLKIYVFKRFLECIFTHFCQYLKVNVKITTWSPSSSLLFARTTRKVLALLSLPFSSQRPSQLYDYNLVQPSMILSPRPFRLSRFQTQKRHESQQPKDRSKPSQTLPKHTAPRLILMGKNTHRNDTLLLPVPSSLHWS
jgi:hypothetical protein